ncbi:MAG: hypothetical protein LBI81_02045, partial [Puniceicoccales bacterium]|nr:hypothetical protein [Puniceicoccales bacterium]
AIEEGKQSACASRLHDYETKDEWLHNSETEDERVLKRKIQEQDIINRIEKRFELNMLSSNSSELAENFNSTSSSSTESAASVNSSASDDKGKNKDEKPQKEE